MTTVSRLVADNGIERPNELSVGETLVILHPTMTYTVRSGDTLLSIAERLGIDKLEIYRNNPILRGKEDIYPGQELIVSLDTINTDSISVNGYAYPNIDRDLLREILPYLTYLSIFTYGVKDDGSLVVPDDRDLIETAKEYKTAPVMVISTLNERGAFDSDIAVRVLSDPDFQNTVINNIEKAVLEKEYYAVDVDFEYIPGRYAEEYAEFIAALRERLAPMEKKVFAALSPKVRADQEGLLYEGHDYGLVGEAADMVLLMTYEWGYTFGPAMAVSPIPNVRRVIEYAVTEISPDKIILGVPNYGYDWTLPFVEGESRARSIGNEEALRLAKDRRARIRFDDEQRAPTFNYYDIVNGKPIEHEVWFENARSVYETLELVDEFGLEGIGIWNLMRSFTQMWTVINSTYNIKKIL
jgi:spore germination protein